MNHILRPTFRSLRPAIRAITESLATRNILRVSLNASFAELRTPRRFPELKLPKRSNGTLAFDERLSREGKKMTTVP